MRQWPVQSGFITAGLGLSPPLLCSTTFNQAPLSISGRPSLGPTASIRSPQNSAEGCISKILPFLSKPECPLCQGGGRRRRDANTLLCVLRTSDGSLVNEPVLRSGSLK